MPSRLGAQSLRFALTRSESSVFRSTQRPFTKTAFVFAVLQMSRRGSAWNSTKSANVPGSTLPRLSDPPIARAAALGDRYEMERAFRWPEINRVMRVRTSVTSDCRAASADFRRSTNCR